MSHQEEPRRGSSVAYRTLLIDEGAWDEAEEAHRLSVERGRRAGNTQVWASALVMIGHINVLRGDLTLAEQAYRQALMDVNLSADNRPHRLNSLPGRTVR